MRLSDGSEKRKRRCLVFAKFRPLTSKIIFFNNQFYLMFAFMNVLLLASSPLCLHIWGCLISQSPYSVLCYVLEQASWNQESIRNGNFQCRATEKAARSRSGQMERKYLRDAGISKDKLCGVLQKILERGLSLFHRKKGCRGVVPERHLLAELCQCFTYNTSLRTVISILFQSRKKKTKTKTLTMSKRDRYKNTAVLLGY